MPLWVAGGLAWMVAVTVAFVALARREERQVVHGEREATLAQQALLNAGLTLWYCPVLLAWFVVPFAQQQGVSPTLPVGTVAGVVFALWRPGYPTRVGLLYGGPRIGAWDRRVEALVRRLRSRRGMLRGAAPVVLLACLAVAVFPLPDVRVDWGAQGFLALFGLLLGAGATWGASYRQVFRSFRRELLLERGLDRGRGAGAKTA